MKIFFVSPYYKPYLGGIERVIEKLGQEFVRIDKQNEVGVLTSKWSFPRRYHPDWKKEERIQESEVKSQNGEHRTENSENRSQKSGNENGNDSVPDPTEWVFRLSSWPSIAPPFFQVPLVWFSPWEIAKIIDHFQPDVIQLMSDRWFWVNFWVVFWARRKQIPVVFSLSFHRLSKPQSFLRPINAYLTRRVEKVQVITEHEKKLVRETYWTPEERLVVIPWGVEGEVQNSKFKIQNDRKGSTTIILSVGRVSRHKGQLWLARVYQMAKFDHPTQLVLVGDTEDPEVADQLKSLKLPTGKDLNLTGQISDTELENWYQRAGIFALFPAYEAFGLVFLEAMAHGIPVLTHRVGALAEVLKKGAIIANPYDRLQAITELSQLVNDVNLRDNLGKEGRKYVVEKFSWQKTSVEFKKQYDEIREVGNLKLK